MNSRDVMTKLKRMVGFCIMSKVTITNSSIPQDRAKLLYHTRIRIFLMEL